MGDRPVTPGTYVIVKPEGYGSREGYYRGSTVAFLVRLDGEEAVIRRLRGGYPGKRSPTGGRPPSLMKPVRVLAARLVREATAREVALHRVETPLQPREAA